MRTVTVYYSDGHVDTININGTNESIKDYFKIGKVFNLGNGENDLIAKVTAIKIHIDTNGLETDISKDLAYGAKRNTSFSPEKYGKIAMDSYIKRMQELAEFIEQNAKDEKQQAIKQEVFDNLRERYKNKYIAMLQAESRCISPMITGPANFPTRRAEKANEAERKRSDEWLTFHDKLNDYALKNLQACYTSVEKQDSELEAYRKKVEKTAKLQEDMKLVNKAHAAYIKNPDSATTKKAMEALSSERQQAIKDWQPPHYAPFQKKPFPTYMLTNNNANLKRMQARLAELESKERARTEQGNISNKFEGLEVLRNFDEDRLQLIFDDMPSDELRTTLKRRGFKWSPRFNAWQRKLTDNAIYTLKRLLRNELSTFKPIQE